MFTKVMTRYVLKNVTNYLSNNKSNEFIGFWRLLRIENKNPP